MRVFKNRFFTRFAAKEGISDEALKAAVDEMERGLCGDTLGGEVYKKRIARAGAGKSGGYRVIVFFKSGERTFFVYGFAKSDRDNINKKELKALREDAKEALAMNDGLLQERLKKGRWIELIDGESNKWNK